MPSLVKPQGIEIAGNPSTSNICVLRNSTGVPSGGNGGSAVPASMLIGEMTVVGEISKSTVENALPACRRS